MTYNLIIEKQKDPTMSKPPPAGRSMLSALLASQSKKPQKAKNTGTNEPSLESAASDTEVGKELSVSSNLQFSLVSNSKVYDRTTKVAKTGYADHGAHAVVVDEKSFSLDEASSTTGGDKASEASNPLTPKKRSSPGFRFHRENRNSSREAPKPTSLLHAALTQGGIVQNKNDPFLPQRSPELGECLTNPSDPISNDGYDNIEGNLIIHKNALLKIPNRKVQNHSSDTNSFLNNNDPLGTTTFQVIGLLGQGTFAQVFHCKNLDTGKMCAVKIVKNKPAYTRQATIEIDVFKTMLNEKAEKDSLDIQSEETGEKAEIKDFMVSLLCYFMYKSHLCLVFELLGQNLYELLKRRQFRGLPVKIVRDVVRQAIVGITELSRRKIVHCDLKPENILVISDEVTQLMVDSNKCSKKQVLQKNSAEPTNSDTVLYQGHTIKLIDFGSACYEGSSGFTYIQSRFYRSPEVLVGINYDSAIDMWSLGCVAAELFLGLPILPGVHELDQLGRIQEMIGDVPDWMLEQGKKTMKYYSVSGSGCGSKDGKMQWKLKTREEFTHSLSQEEVEKYGGISKLEQPPANRYFKYKHLHDIVIHHGNCKSADEKELLFLFVHFLKGLLNPDPCERWTAYQASSHPFLTGNTAHLRLKLPDSQIKSDKDVQWSPPWDPSICRRKLAFKQGALSKNQRRRSTSNRRVPQDDRPQNLVSPNTLRVMNLTGAMSLTHVEAQQSEQNSPPINLSNPRVHSRLFASRYQPSTSMGALSAVHDLPNQRYQQEGDLSLSLHQHFDSAVPPRLYSSNINSMPQSHGAPVLMGPQSFSGAYHSGAMGQVAPQGDLGYALQRPGVVPCTSTTTMQQMNHLYLQQQSQMQPASIANLAQASSVGDMGPLSRPYMNVQAMSLPSIQTHESIPQNYALNRQMPYSSNASSYNDHSQPSRRDRQVPYFPYRGSSM